jgi:hypothetical protein
MKKRICWYIIVVFFFCMGCDFTFKTKNEPAVTPPPVITPPAESVSPENFTPIMVTPAPTEPTTQPTESLPPFQPVKPFVPSPDDIHTEETTPVKELTKNPPRSRVIEEIIREKEDTIEAAKLRLYGRSIVRMPCSYL